MLPMALRLLLIIAFTCLLTGCWDLRQPEETGIVIGLGLDRKDDGTIVIIAQTVRPRPPGAGGAGGGGGGQDPKPFHNWYSTGETVFDAVRNLSLMSPNVMFFAHNQVFIISERLAKHGVLEVMDFLERDPEVKQSGWLVVARGDIQDVMQSSEFAQQAPVQMIADVISLHSRNTKYAPATLAEFLQALNTPNASAYAPGVTYFKGIMKDQEEMTQTVAEAKRPNELKISETAIFREDKLVGWFTPIEGKGLLWIRGDVQQGLVVFPFEGKKFTFEVFGSNSKIKPLVRDGRLVMRVEITARGNLGEASPGIYDLDEKKLKELEKALGEVIASQVLAAVNKAKELNTDVFGFGAAVHRKFPEQWNKEISTQWQELFRDLEVEVAAEGSINGLGRITTSVNPRPQK